MLDRCYQFFTSLKLTFALLCLAAVLVFLGTMAQDPLGLYLVQERFFKSLFVDSASMVAAVKKTLQMAHVYLPPTTAADVMAAPYFPVFPGGYLLGTLLVVNLGLAHLRYYRTTWRKAGIILIHLGILVMLVGQLATDLFQVESHLRLAEGETKNYSESGLANELVIIDTTAPDQDHVMWFSERRVAREPELRHPSLPFTVRVQTYHRNATPRVAPTTAPQNSAVRGVGQRLGFEGRPPVTRLDARDVPAALVEILDGPASLGRWWVSNWLVEESLVEMLRQEVGAAIRPLLGAPQTFQFKGRTYQLALRPARYYKSFSLQLLKFSHDKYPGTEIPKNFSSRVRVLRPEAGEDREVLIYMNNPLRYAGETFYQASFAPDNDQRVNKVTILQVVRNPGRLTPYLGCLLVAAGMTFQFLTHLLGFAKGQREMEQSASAQFTLERLRSLRAYYLTTLVLNVAANVSYFWIGHLAWLGSVPLAIATIGLLLAALRRTGFSTTRLVSLAVIFLLVSPVPFVPLLVAMLCDRIVWKRIRVLREESRTV